MTTNFTFRFVAVAAAVLMSLACSDSGTAPAEPVASVTVDPAEVDLEVNGTVQLTAILRDRKNRVLTGRAVG